MLLEAYVLPDVDGAIGVVFLQPRPESRQAIAERRDVRGTAGLSLDVYTPAPTAPADLALAGAALTTATGNAIGSSPRWRVRRVLWWLLGTLATLALAWRALDSGPGFAWIAVLTGFLSLPPFWINDRNPLQWWHGIFRAVRGLGRSTGASASLARALPTLEITAGTQAETKDQLLSLWAISRRLDGSPSTRFAAMESHCRDRGWRHVAAYYQSRARSEKLAGQGQRRMSNPWITFEGHAT
ncbi:hypothetical protein LBMAG38_05760 [Chloroflexota bacterium]|jgi:hypothetical protein|nr:hypothetical protein [Pseudomonadota bacterium]GDX69485.1 hypothetical protein LBMAG38_05760 [Chloroflexota bacterium]